MPHNFKVGDKICLNFSYFNKFHNGIYMKRIYIIKKLHSDFVTLNTNSVWHYSWFRLANKLEEVFYGD